MHFFALHGENIRQSSMSSRLLWPCLLLAALLLLTFGAALFLFASLHNTKRTPPVAWRSSIRCSRTIWNAILTSWRSWA